MNSTQHGEHLTQLTRLGLVNCYLVREDDGLTLVDTSISGSADSIIAAARDLGAPIKRIVLTHGHHDHAGSLDALADALPEAEIALPERDARFLRGDKSMDAGEKPKPPGPMAKCRCAAAAQTFATGERIGSLEVIATPGHTPGHVAFLDTRDGTLLGGDVFANVGGLRASTKPRLPFPLPAFGTWDRAACLESARTLSSLRGITCLALGHGAVLDSPAPAMSAAAAKG